MNWLIRCQLGREVSVRTIFNRFVLTVATILGCTMLVHAGAWNQEPGHGQVILTSSYFDSSRAFDGSGTDQKFASSGDFRQLLFQSYFEVGVIRRITVVGNIYAPVLRYSDTSGALYSAGLGDIELGTKLRLNSLESPWTVSAQISAEFPTYSVTEDPAPGNHQEDVEARLLVGNGSDWQHHHGFWDAEVAYRYRTGAPADQIRGDFTAGVDLTRRFMAMAQIFTIKGLRNGGPFDATNPNAQSDFDLYKAQISLVTSITRRMRIQAGWNNTFAGRNTGRGSALILAIWKSF